MTEFTKNGSLLTHLAVDDGINAKLSLALVFRHQNSHSIAARSRENFDGSKDNAREISL